MPVPFIHLTEYLQERQIPLGPWATAWHSPAGPSCVQLHLVDHHTEGVHTRGPAPAGAYVKPCMDCCLYSEADPIQNLWAEGFWVVAVLLQRLEEWRQLTEPAVFNNRWEWLFRLGHSLHEFSTAPQALIASQPGFMSRYPFLFADRPAVRPGSDLAAFLGHLDQLVTEATRAANALPAAQTAWAELERCATGPATYLALPTYWIRAGEASPAEAAAHVWGMTAPPIAHNAEWTICRTPGTIPQGYAPLGVLLHLPPGVRNEDIRRALDLWDGREPQTSQTFTRLLDAVTAASSVG
jgi:hypothetical protein